ncbi:phosphatidylglycerol lysyltransferase domain-containing protein [Streptococcus catagoni]|uniref:phosphatidylglycerol lysyltransferase domain-containing protein n=1 Tax=Streptococcus catagoni TaxID=2654874 RepID=UPI001F3470C6|nr:phosphatidylglycerol lysyltransferase domain-containing protein [Streptococcus catagoni]
MKVLTFFKEKQNQLLKDIIVNGFFYLMIFLFYLSGITLVLMVTSHDSIINLPIIRDKLYGFTGVVLIRQVPSLMLGFSLLICGRAIGNRYQKAFFPTLIFLLLSFIYTLFFYSSVFPSLLLSLLIAFLCFSRSLLYRQQLIITAEDGLLDGLIWLFLIISYFLLGYRNLVGRNHPVRVPVAEHFSVPSLHWWFMGLLGLLVMILSLLIFMISLKKRRHYIGQVFDQQRYLAVLEKGDHHYSNLAFLGDKRIWYFQKDGQDMMALQFKPIGDKLLVMGDFIGDQTYFDQALSAFMTEADTYNFHPVFYEISESQVLSIHDYGFDFIKLGEEGMVSPENFTLSGKKRQNLRSVTNQVTKAGFQFQVVSPPYNQAFLEELSKVSKDWLNGRQEMSFSLGNFDPAYLSHADMATLSNVDGEVVAFASLEYSKSEDSLSVDLMRYSKEAPKGVMDVLFIQIITYAKERGISSFNIGMSPLSKVGQYRFSFFTEKLGHLLYRYGSQIYSFNGLRKYKEKFAHYWVPYYIAYPKQTLFPLVILALLKASYQSDKKN